nr:immunoglobulin light chain junction region [Macaca mulatta]MOV77960.1 immunoglobulin light chain junction region [Macaca mulatta]MOV79975.1 immunoglobulin light chain junction region [Macaca mulatta]MOV80799.1 immunoglobulin light chain junction region [Macaca mulatta]MOV82871.1 immunoglobulin light chain junction region [Macaca mulatta]
CLQYKNFPLSF